MGGKPVCVAESKLFFSIELPGDQKVLKSRLKMFLFSQAFSSSSAHKHVAWPQRLWSYDHMALYKSVYY